MILLVQGLTTEQEREMIRGKKRDIQDESEWHKVRKNRERERRQ